MTSKRKTLPIGLGVIGLGRGFMLSLPSILADDRVRLVAATAPRAASRNAFTNQFDARAYSDAAQMCADPAVEAVYIATPHHLHADHVAMAAAAGKHILVEKPLSISLADGQAMVATARAAGVHLIVGPSHSFDAPVLQARALIEAGNLGRVRMVQSLNYTDFLYRPRRPEELRTETGGGVLFNQAVHQIDVLRLLAGSPALTVQSMTGAWDPARPTEGAYSALIGFEGGAFASITYSGYAHFDSNEWMDWVGELGQPSDPNGYGAARRALATVSTPKEEAALKSGRTFGTAPVAEPAPNNEHFGPVIVACDRGDLRLTPKGVWFYGDEKRQFLPAPTTRAPRTPVIDALWQAIRHDQPPRQSGEWGLASLEICHAILNGAKTGGTVSLLHQNMAPRGGAAFKKHKG